MENKLKNHTFCSYLVKLLRSSLFRWLSERTWAMESGKHELQLVLHIRYMISWSINFLMGKPGFNNSCLSGVLFLDFSSDGASDSNMKKCMVWGHIFTTKLCLSNPKQVFLSLYLTTNESTYESTQTRWWEGLSVMPTWQNCFWFSKAAGRTA